MMLMFKFAAVLVCAFMVNGAPTVSGDNNGTSGDALIMPTGNCTAHVLKTCTIAFLPVNYATIDDMTWTDRCCTLSEIYDCVEREGETKSCPGAVFLAKEEKKSGPTMCTAEGATWGDCNSSSITSGGTSEGDDDGNTDRPATGDDEASTDGSTGSAKGSIVENSSVLGGGAVASIVIGCIVGVAVIVGVVMVKIQRY